MVCGVVLVVRWRNVATRCRRVIIMFHMLTIDTETRDA